MGNPTQYNQTLINQFLILKRVCLTRSVVFIFRSPIGNFKRNNIFANLQRNISSLVFVV